MDRDLRLDVIAVWRRDSDKIELHLRRDGKVFYRHRPTKEKPEGSWEDGSGNGACSIDSIEQWIAEGKGAGFKRKTRLQEN